MKTSQLDLFTTLEEVKESKELRTELLNVSRRQTQYYGLVVSVLSILVFLLLLEIGHDQSTFTNIVCVSLIATLYVDLCWYVSVLGLWFKCCTGDGYVFRVDLAYSLYVVHFGIQYLNELKNRSDPERVKEYVLSGALVHLLQKIRIANLQLQGLIYKTYSMSCSIILVSFVTGVVIHFYFKGKKTPLPGPQTIMTSYKDRKQIGGGGGDIVVFIPPSTTTTPDEKLRKISKPEYLYDIGTLRNCAKRTRQPFILGKLPWGGVTPLAVARAYGGYFNDPIVRCDAVDIHLQQINIRVDDQRFFVHGVTQQGYFGLETVQDAIIKRYRGRVDQWIDAMYIIEWLFDALELQSFRDRFFSHHSLLIFPINSPGGMSSRHDLLKRFRVSNESVDGLLKNQLLWSKMEAMYISYHDSRKGNRNYKDVRDVVKLFEHNLDLNEN